jgi:hypothetical protein
MERTESVPLFVLGPLGLLAQACQAKCCMLRTKAWPRYYATRLGRTLVEPRSASLGTRVEKVPICEVANIEPLRDVT